MHLSIQNPLQTKQIYLADDKSQLSSCLRTSFHDHPEVSLAKSCLCGVTVSFVLLNKFVELKEKLYN